MSEEKVPSVLETDPRAKWIAAEYFRSLSANISDAQRYFNDLISWSNNLVLANVLAVGVTVLIGKNGIPFDALAGLGLFMLTLHHYLVLRSARGYANLIRFTSLQKDVTAWIIGGATAARQVEIESRIQKYHVSWTAPLHRLAILKKVWFSSGAFFHALLIATGVVLCFCNIEASWCWNLIGSLTLVANIVLFTLFFWRASYFSKAEPYPSAIG